MRTSGGTHRLFRHDWQIAANTTRAAFAGWGDRLIAGILLLIALAGLRSWFADRDWTIAAWAAVTIGLVSGLAAGYFAIARLAFHGSDGLLAADALHPPARLKYTVVWLSIGGMMLSGIMLIVRPSVLIVCMAAYLAGVVMAGLADVFGKPWRISGSARPGWSIRAWLGHPSAGVMAGIFLLLAVLPGRSHGVTATLAVAGVGSALLALTLTLVDHSAVRFMTIAGYGTWRIVRRLSRALMSFVLVAVAGCWLLFGTASAGIVAGASATMLLLLALRVVACRLHGRHVADLLVLILVGLLVLVGHAIPVALPFVAIAMLWHLQRRAAAKTWLLA